MADSKNSDKYNTPAWVKWSAGIAIVLNILVVSHFLIGGMTGMHSMAAGG